MDFSTMRKKLLNHEYNNWGCFQVCCAAPILHCQSCAHTVSSMSLLSVIHSAAPPQLLTLCLSYRVLSSVAWSWHTGCSPLLEDRCHCFHGRQSALPVQQYVHSELPQMPCHRLTAHLVAYAWQPVILCSLKPVTCVRLQTDLYLIFDNARVYNPQGHKIFKIAGQMKDTATDFIQKGKQGRLK